MEVSSRGWPAVRLLLLRLALLVGVLAGVAVVDPSVGGWPALVAAGVVILLVAHVTDHRVLLTALAAATSSLVRTLTCVVAPRPSAPSLEAALRRRRGELARRGAVRRLQRPNVPGKPRARAPGSA